MYDPNANLELDDLMNQFQNFVTSLIEERGPNHPISVTSNAFFLALLHAYNLQDDLNHCYDNVTKDDLDQQLNNILEEINEAKNELKKIKFML